MLTNEIICLYLPYKPQVLLANSKSEYLTTLTFTTASEFIKTMKLVLKPMSEATTEIRNKLSPDGQYQLWRLREAKVDLNLRYSDMKILLQEHYDVFRLFDSGNAIHPKDL